MQMTGSFMKSICERRVYFDHLLLNFSCILIIKLHQNFPFIKILMSIDGHFEE